MSFLFLRVWPLNIKKSTMITAASSYSTISKPLPVRHLHSFSPSSSSSFSRSFLNIRRRPPSSLPIVAAHHSFDVVVVGAGVIGLTIARQLLTSSDLSVAVVDKAVPCAGATGAGQGYIWMSHKTPGTDIWELSLRSQRLWELLADSVRDEGLDPADVLGWKKTGSLLIGNTIQESLILQQRVKQLSEAFVEAEYLSSGDLMLKEPDLTVCEESGAAFLPNDCQLDAKLAVAFIQKGNRTFASQGRYAEFFHNPVKSLLRSGGKSEVEGIVTTKHTVLGKKAVVVAAGCWTGSLMCELVKETDIRVDIPVKPRKGHLLVLENSDLLQVNHGLMEVGYVNHQHAKPDKGTISDPVNDGQLSISMTATTDVHGHLVLGSSRQFVGFCDKVDKSIIDRIWKRAGDFFPKLKDINLAEVEKRGEVRIGLRPYMPEGKPVIGLVPGLSNLFVAAGHEGSGLSLALGTAEMVADMILRNPAKVDVAPFALRS